MKCNSACLTCTTDSVCQSCQSINGVGYYLDVNFCTVSCPSTQYGGSGYLCLNCHDSCLTCFGGAANQCRTCKTNNSIPYYLVYKTTFCNDTCPNGQYKNDTDNTCGLCSSGCVTCVSTSTNCLTCGFSSDGLNLYFNENRCLMNCPNSKWPN